MFYGMLAVTLFGLLFTPVVYVVARAVARRRFSPGPMVAGAAATTPDDSVTTREQAWVRQPRIPARSESLPVNRGRNPIVQRGPFLSGPAIGEGQYG